MRTLIFNLNWKLETGNIATIYAAIGEAETWRLLSEIGWKLSSEDFSPDFYGTLNGRNAYFEVRTPEPNDVPKHMLQPEWEAHECKGISYQLICGNLDYKSVELRLTKAIKDKSRAFKKYIEKNTIDANAERIIIVSTMQLGMNADLSVTNVPSIIDVVFGVGPRKALLTETGKITECKQVQSHSLMNKNGAEVPTTFFLNSDNRHIDAVIGLFHPYAIKPKHKGAEAINPYGRLNSNPISALNLPLYTVEKENNDIKITEHCPKTI